MTIAITGLGVAGACGDLDGLRAALDGTTVEATAAPCSPDGADTVPAFLAATDGLDAFIPPRTQRRLDAFTRLALLGALRALEDAGLSEDAHEDLGLVVATGYGPTSTTLAFLASAFDDGDACASPIRFSHAVHNAAASTLALRLGIRGPCMTVAQFGLSVPAALLAAQQMLTEGRARRVLFGAVDEYCELVGYCYRRFFDPTTDAPAPLDWDRQTAKPGAGAVFALLDAQTETGAYAVLEAVHLGAGPLPSVPLPDAWFLGADGHRTCGVRYPERLPAGARVFSCAGAVGSLPVGPAFDLAAAAACLRDGRLPDDPQGDDGTSPGCIDCLRLNDHDEYGLLRLRAVGGADA